MTCRSFAWSLPLRRTAIKATFDWVPTQKSDLLPKCFPQPPTKIVIQPPLGIDRAYRRYSISWNINKPWVSIDPGLTSNKASPYNGPCTIPVSWSKVCTPPKKWAIHIHWPSQVIVVTRKAGKSSSYTHIHTYIYIYNILVYMYLYIYLFK